MTRVVYVHSVLLVFSQGAKNLKIRSAQLTLQKKFDGLNG